MIKKKLKFKYLLKENISSFVISIILGILIGYFSSEPIINKKKFYESSSDFQFSSKIVNPTQILYESSKILDYKLIMSPETTIIFTDTKKNNLLINDELCPSLEVKKKFEYSIFLNIKVSGRNPTLVRNCHEFLNEYFLESLNKLQTKYEENQKKTIKFYKKIVDDIGDSTQLAYINNQIVELLLESNATNNVKPALIFIDFKLKNSGQLKLLKPLIIFSFITLFLILNFIFIFYFRKL